MTSGPLAIALAVLAAAVALATWIVSGDGVAHATAGSLDRPSGLLAEVADRTVTIGFDGVVGPRGHDVDGYEVFRTDLSDSSRTNACATGAGTLLAPGATSCVDTDVPPGRYVYTVTAVFRTWTAASLPTAEVVVEAPVDTEPPVGSLEVDGTAATEAGVTVSSTSGSFTGVATWFTDAGSGVADEWLTREDGELVDGSCGSFDDPVDVASVEGDDLPTGCYRFRHGAVDGAGNRVELVATVEVDRDDPSQVLAVAGDAVLVDGTVHFRPDLSGSFVVESTVTDHASGPASVRFPAVADAGWDHDEETVTAGTGVPPTVTYSSGPLAWVAGASGPGPYTVTGHDRAGRVVQTTITVSADAEGPTGGALTVAGTPATAAGAGVVVHDTAWSIDQRLDWSADEGSGLAGSELTVERAPLDGTTCGAYESSTVVVGTPAQTGEVDTCVRYTLTGFDVLGNLSSISVVVQVVAPAPADVTTPGTGTNPGRVNAGDRLVVAFGEDIDLNTFCPGWDGSVLSGNNDQGVQLHLLDDAYDGNDAIVLVPEARNPCAGADFGTFDLGSPGYTTVDRVYDGNGNGSINQSRVWWDADRRELVVQVGAGTVSDHVGASVVTYVPPPGLRTVGGTPVTRTYSTAPGEQF